MHTFGKQERLCSKKLIDTLFQSGHRFIVFPYSVHWMLCHKGTLPGNVSAQVLITTSKKKFHHAVDRNRVKRLTRECYRTNKDSIYTALSAHGAELILSLNYIHNEILDYHTLNHKTEHLFRTLISNITSQLDDTSELKQ